MTAQVLAQTLEDSLIGAGDAGVLEDGTMAFDLAQAKCSVSGETHKYLVALYLAADRTGPGRVGMSDGAMRSVS